MANLHTIKRAFHYTYRIERVTSQAEGALLVETVESNIEDIGDAMVLHGECMKQTRIGQNPSTQYFLCVDYHEEGD